MTAPAYRPLSAVAICAAALKRGALIRQGRHWNYRGRLFRNGTIKTLIERGKAERRGDIVREVHHA